MLKRFYDIAQVCLNGHIINSSANKNSIHNKDFCQKCGSRTIKNCLNCGMEIQGDYYHIIPNWTPREKSFMKIGRFVLPRFCSKCGASFPWTENRIEVSKKIISETENLTQEEKELFTKNIDGIIKDTPETIDSSRKIKQLLPKLGKEILKDIRKIIVDIASETAKKIIFPES